VAAGIQTPRTIVAELFPKLGDGCRVGGWDDVKVLTSSTACAAGTYPALC
jgi:hypothetical protein